MAKTTGMQLVTNFNIITGLKLRTGENDKKNTPNADKMEDLLKRGIPFDRICNYMEDWYRDNHDSVNSDTAMVMFYTTTIAKHSRNEMPRSTAWNKGVRVTDTPKTEMPVPEPPKAEPKREEPKAEPVTTSSKEQEAAGFLEGITNLVADVIIKQKAVEITSAVKAEAIEEIKAFVRDNYGALPKVVKIESEHGVREVHGITHEKFEKVLDAVNMGLNVMLVGGAGSGKNVLCEQVAEALGLKFYMSNAVTQEYKITGFTDANGVYHPTPFYEAWTNGGLFMLDEVDASIADVLVTINAALSNGYADFPAPIGNVKKHKDFHVIAAGNTYGLGADYEYVGRNVIDAATRNRFMILDIGYSANIEEAMADGDNELLEFCRNFRNVCSKLGVKAIMSYRNIKTMATLSKSKYYTKKDIIESCVASGMRYDDLNMISNEIMMGGAWKTAFTSLVKERRATA